MRRPKLPCIECGGPSVRAGWCAKHYPKGVSEKTAWALSNRRRKIRAGICLRCHEPVMKGKRYCEKHKHTYREIQKRIDSTMAAHILKKAIRDAQKRRDSESIFFDPEFEEKHRTLNKGKGGTK